MQRLLLYILLTFMMTNTWSQNVVFEKITTREGLSQNDVNAIYQDENGFLWIGTNDGLNRYDGYSFKTYRVDPESNSGISSNLIYKIAEDPNENLWLGTSDEGVCRLDMKTEQFTVIKNTSENPNLLSSNQVICLHAAKDGSIWVGTNFGLDILRKVNEEYQVIRIDRNTNPELLSADITDIEEDPYGRKWVGTKQGLYVITENHGIFNIQTVSDNDVVKDIFISETEVFVAYFNGIYKLFFNWENLGGMRQELINNTNANCIVLSENGELYMGMNYGFSILARDSLDRNRFSDPLVFTEGWETNSLSKNHIYTIYEDQSGIIWIGTNGGGLNKYNPKRKKFKHFNRTRIAGSLSNNKIRAIFEDREHNIWVGTEGGGINFLSVTDNKDYNAGWQAIDVNTTSYQNYVYTITDLMNTGPPDILAGVGYSNVITRFTVSGNQAEIVAPGFFSQIENSPFALLRDRDGIIWIGTYGQNGLIRYSKDENGESFVEFHPDNSGTSLSSNHIRSLMEDHMGNIWIGTDNGLSLLSVIEKQKSDPTFQTFQKDADNPYSINHNYILPIYQSRDNTIWVGTMGGGLNKVIYSSNPDSIYFESITTRDGLPNNVIKGILEDDYGFLWISSNKGLTRYDIRDKIFVNYDISDGLQDNEFGELACCKLSDGEMLFGGVNGINAFNPRDIYRDMSMPQIALTDFQIYNQSVKPGEKVNGRILLESVINHTDRIQLRYSEKSFAIHFSSLHFSAPQKNNYKYMLEGFDQDWVRKDATDRIAKYSNLRAGKYVFKVQASNNDGIWTDNPKVLYITVTPPWWLSKVAWVVYIVLFITGIWFFQRYSLIRIQQKNELLMEHFEKEKIKELSQMKLRFFTNISHEFRTPLTLIIGPLERLIKQGSSLSEVKVRENYSIMHRNASILLKLINQLIDFRKFEQGKMKLRATHSNIVAFLNEVYISFSEMANNKKIAYSFNTPREEIMVWFDNDKLEKIMYNLLSNAFKYTQEDGQIDITIEESGNRVVIAVIDKGVGIPKENQKHIFEHFYQAERIKNRKVGSTGIGLSFIKGLVEMHQGEISFESKEDEGTTFYVSLLKGSNHLENEQMLIDLELQKETSTKDIVYLETKDSNGEPEEVKDEGTVHDKNKPLMLLVEDNFELRAFIKDSLSDQFNIHVAENGKEGLELTYEMDPNIIVSDIMMPVMNGFELCNTIKSDEKISHIPVILLTAKSTEENRIKGYELGADGYISKPFSIDVLKARIINLIESREALKQTLRSNIKIEPSEVTTTSMDEKFLERILHIIEENIPNSDFTVEQLSSVYGMSQSILNKKLRGLTGQTAKAFIRTIRLKRAAQLFSTGKYSVAEITYEVGFSDLKYFRTCFKDEFGLSPSDYIRQHKSEE